MGLPVCFIPHLATQPPVIREPRTFKTIAAAFAVGDFGIPGGPLIEPRTDLPGDAWVAAHEAVLRRRLSHFPGGYEFAMLRMVRELADVCDLIARFVTGGPSPRQATHVIRRILFEMSLHAVNQGLLGLAYHGWGFHAGIAREEVVKLLADVRASGSISRRDLQRRMSGLSAAVRDKVLERLAAENLVRLEASQVTAVALADFIRSLSSRPGFPAPRRMKPEFLNQWDPALAG